MSKWFTWLKQAAVDWLLCCGGATSLGMTAPRVQYIKKHTRSFV